MGTYARTACGGLLFPSLFFHHGENVQRCLRDVKAEKSSTSPPSLLEDNNVSLDVSRWTSSSSSMCIQTPGCFACEKGNSDSADLGWGPRFCLSETLPDVGITFRAAWPWHKVVAGGGPPRRWPRPPCMPLPLHICSCRPCHLACPPPPQSLSVGSLPPQAGYLLQRGFAPRAD